jgi:hypothetical protein
VRPEAEPPRPSPDLYAAARNVVWPAAADRLRLITSFDAFDLRYTGRGITADEVAGELVTMAERAVLR